MKILALDLGKFKSVACDYEAETGKHQFRSVATTPQALHDLIVDHEPDRVVIEICSIAGWVSDLVRRLGIEIEVINTNDQYHPGDSQLLPNNTLDPGDHDNGPQFEDCVGRKVEGHIRK